MLDISLIRREPERVVAAIRKRGMEIDLQGVLQLDEQRRALIAEGEALKAERNRVNKDIPRLKKEGADIASLLEEMKASGERVKAIDEELRCVDERLHQLLAALPNMPAEDVPAGGKEQNVVKRVYGEKPAFAFTPKNHVDLCTSLQLIDYERGVKMAGSGFWLYTGMGAQIEWALLSYFIAQHTKDGFRFMLPPHILSYESGYAAGQFPKFEEDIFRLAGEGFRFMLPTSETALVNLYRDEIVEEADLPQRLFAYSPCYRSEAGTYRASERGMVRGHQFNKVEMFAFCAPEDSAAIHRQLIDKACSLLEGLELHYRLSQLAAGDCSASMATTWDAEVWMPSMNEYKEVSSISNAHDYQARRGGMRLRRADKRLEYMHTLNGSGLATSRILPAIVEQHQQADGSVTVPKALRPFLGVDRITPP